LDTTAVHEGSWFDSNTIFAYLGILALLIALYFMRKYIYKLDEFFNKNRKKANGRYSVTDDCYKWIASTL
jgi:hypothetical protein